VIDLEAIISRVLRTDPTVSGVVADRVWLSRPKDPTYPAVFVGRVAGMGGIPFNGPPLHDEGDFDLHCYGGSRVQSLELAQASVAALAVAKRSLGIEPWNLLHLPDPDLPKEGGRDRERYIVTVHAWASFDSVTP
jgi:hypothetical protein